MPYYIAMAPDYDLTLSPRITTKQGPLMQAEWRQRLENGFYTIKGAGLYQFDKDYFIRERRHADAGLPRLARQLGIDGPVSISPTCGRSDGTRVLVTDPVFFQNYRIRSLQQRSGDPLGLGLTEGISQLFLTGRGDRSYFDARTIYYTGFSEADVQSALPFIHPVIDYSRTLETPVLGGELGYSVNLTSLSRASADFDPISNSAYSNGYCAPSTADPAVKTPTNCLLRGIAGDYSRLSAETTGSARSSTRLGRSGRRSCRCAPKSPTSMFATKSASLISSRPGETQTARIMPTVGVEYRYPFIGVQSWGTQTIEPIAQLIVRPSEQRKVTLPNEDAQSLIYDDTNLFKVDKFSGWDRTEGGGRANAGIQYTAQFNRGGFVNVLFGQSYQLFGENSFAHGRPDQHRTRLRSRHQPR